MSSSGLAIVEPAFDESDGGGKVAAEFEQQVDVVEVRVAMEAVGEVVPEVHAGEHFATAWAVGKRARGRSHPPRWSGHTPFRTGLRVAE